MSCYQRHLGSLFEALGLEHDAANRDRVDAAIRKVLGLGDDVRCPEVWSALKALPPQARDHLPTRVAELLDL